MNKSIVVLLSLLIGLATLYSYQSPRSSQLKDLTFQTYKQTFKLEFNTLFENRYREAIFKQNIQKIQAHNNVKDRTYDMGVNQFTHLTQEQFVKIYLLQSPPVISSATVDETHISIGDTNWVTAGAVTAVRNSGSGADSYSIVATSSVESLYKIKDGTLYSLANEQVAACAKRHDLLNTVEYLKNPGLLKQSDYNKQKCEQIKNAPFKIKQMNSVETGCSNLLNSIISRPFIVYVDATQWSTYNSGIFSNCGTSLNHAVYLVGTTDTYWLVQNHWGTSWGEQGYIRVKAGNTCGICLGGLYPSK